MAGLVCDLAIIVSLKIGQAFDPGQHTSTKLQSFSTRADLIDVAPHASLQIYLKPKKLRDSIKLEFEVLNALIAPNKHPSIKLERAISSAPQD